MGKNLTEQAKEWNEETESAAVQARKWINQLRKEQEDAKADMETLLSELEASKDR